MSQSELIGPETNLYGRTPERLGMKSLADVGEIRLAVADSTKNEPLELVADETISLSALYAQEIQQMTSANDLDYGEAVEGLLFQ